MVSGSDLGGVVCTSKFSVAKKGDIIIFMLFILLDMVVKSSSSKSKSKDSDSEDENSGEEQKVENEAAKVFPTEKKKIKKHKKIVKPSKLTHQETQAIHQKMLQATRDDSSLPQAVSQNMMPMPVYTIPNSMMNPMPVQTPVQAPIQAPVQAAAQAPMHPSNTLHPSDTFNAPNAQRDESNNDGDFGYEGNENAETTVIHKIKKKHHKKRHHAHRHHHKHHKNAPIKTYDFGKGNHLVIL